MCKPRINRPRYGSLHILLFTIERLNYDAKLAVELVHLVERNPCVRLTRSRWWVECLFTLGWPTPFFYVVDKNQKHLGALSTQADNTVDELDRMPIYINWSDLNRPARLVQHVELFLFVFSLAAMRESTTVWAVKYLKLASPPIVSFSVLNVSVRRKRAKNKIK